MTMASVASATWDLNDVSYLMPLPAKVGADNLLGLEAPGKGGPLLPAKFLASIPPLTVVSSEDEIARSLRVIAVRVDPCFPLPTPQSCQRQIRLVWQPVQIGFHNQTSTEDAALHSFYVLTDDEFTAMLKELAAWKVKYNLRTEGLPLQIHPAWAKEGDRSAAFADFNLIIKKYAGVQNLTRVTSMVLRGAGDMWAFAGFSVQNGKLQLFKVPRLDRSAQAFVNFAVPSDHFERGMISPAPAGDDTLNTVVTNSDKFKVGNEDLLRKELRATFRVENPTVFNPENMDCVSCHVAQTGRVWIQTNRADIGIDGIWSEHSYKNARYNLNNVSPGLKNTQVIRAFGYFGSDVAISQRVINESAEVADLVNQYFK